MKTRYLAFAFTLSLGLLLGSVLLATRGAAPFAANIKFDPKFVDMDSYYPPVWYAEIKTAVNATWPVRDIDPSTILLEGYLPIIPGSAFYYKGAMNVQFDGQAVWNILLAKVGHMGVPPDASTNTPVHYYFTVTGKLLNGESFEGQGWIAVRFPMGLPPPPPPPV